MKKLIFGMLFLLGALNLNAQDSKSNPKSTEKQILVVVNTANWCHVCKANGPRVKENVLANYMTNKNCKVIVNNLSDDATKKSSQEEIARAGISDTMKDLNASGMIYLIDAESKKVINSVSVAKTNEEISQVINEVLTSN